MKNLRWAVIGCFLTAPVFAAGEVKPPVLVEQYAGGFKDDYLIELDRVRTFLGLAQQSISTQLGLLQTSQGFYHPVTIRFDDGAPAISYTSFFYVQPGEGAREAFTQELIVNVEAYARRRRLAQWRDPDLRNGFNYAMTQLILNDLLQRTSTQKLPVWLQEGLSVYMAGDGQELVQEVAKGVTKSRVSEIVGELNRPYPNLSKTQWARYYLAVQYISDTGGINGFQSFVRAVVGGTSAADAIRDSLNQDWATFKDNVQNYSAKIYRQYATEDPKTLP